MELDLRNKKVGDVIECCKDDLGECLKVHHKLAMEGVETDFLYRYNGEDGLWLQITKMGDRNE